MPRSTFSSKARWEGFGCGPSLESDLHPASSMSIVPMCWPTFPLDGEARLHMKILYASTLYPPAVGGAQIHFHCLATQMQALGHAVQVFTCASRNRTDWLRLSTVCPEPPRQYVYDGVPVAQLSYTAAARCWMLPWFLSYYALPGPAVRRIAHILDGQIPWP